MQRRTACDANAPMRQDGRRTYRQILALAVLAGFVGLAGCQIKQRERGVLPREPIVAPPSERRLAAPPVEADAAPAPTRNRLRLPSDRR